MKLASPAMHLVSPGEPVEQSEIERIFAAQRETALRLRQSTAAQRLDKIDHLKRAALARQHLRQIVEQVGGGSTRSTA